MDSPPFYILTQLQREIQLIIWEYAADPDSEPHLDDTFINHIAQPWRNEPMIERFLYASRPLWVTVYTQSPKDIHYNMCLARKTLQEICIMARQVGLLSWKKDVISIRIGARASNSWEEKIAEGKRKIIEMLDEFLGGEGFVEAKEQPLT